MRILLTSLMVVFLASACDSNGRPRLTSSTAPGQVPQAVINVVPRPGVDAGNWSYYFWPEWQAGAGEMLSPGRLVNATVDDQLCVSNLRTAWDAQASCLRFAVSVSSPGKLEAFLHWSTQPAVPGSIVLVAPDGRFTSSDSDAVAHVFALVQPGNYGVLVISHVRQSQPFQLRAEFSN